MHIVDATGKVLATGRQASTLNLSGESPFQIRLDDATAVALTLNQEQISLSPYTVNGKADSVCLVNAKEVELYDDCEPH